MPTSKNNSLHNYLQLSKLAANFNKSLDRSISIIHGIGISEFSVMHSLSSAPNNTMSRIDLATAIGLSASGVTRMLNPMEKIGLIEKEKNARDARVSFVKLTPAGQGIYTDALATFTRTCDELYSPISAKQQSQLNDLISRLI